MDKEKFFNACERLYNDVVKVSENIGKKQEEGYDINQVMLLSTVDDIISEYNNIIQSVDKDEIPNEFLEVFNAAASVKNNTYYASHHKRLMHDAEATQDDDALMTAAQSFIISRKLLLASYKRALIASKSALNLRDQKGL